ncbi:amine sulfotransferase-like [Saccoglossus kowalevskii]|uniref:Amine sulfotransferase-like n=1 Tax=Saccoglossus kowalevskii TaxID=10224 RepID=A0ABM0GTN2_SACKO|nr:PREDICTED: amine sulfotransferase-like [Saccoglossus kowalevskii]
MATYERVPTDFFQQCRNYYFPNRIYDFKKLENDLLNTIEYRKDDVIVVAYPKSGINWMLVSLRELYKNTWGVCRSGDRVMAPLLDWLVFKDGRVIEGIIDDCKTQFLHSNSALPSPRLFCTHLPYEFLPMKKLTEKGAKIICVARNPKDVCTSYHYFMKSWLGGEWSVPWQQLVESDFIDGRTEYGPYTRYILSWYSHGRDENIFHVTYEEMKHKYKPTMKKISEFLEKPVTDADLERIEKSCSFQNMDPKSLPFDDKSFKMGQFCRKGIVGDWKNHFTVAQSEQFDKCIVSELTSNNINFTYE